jgi:hypothetical protein
MRRSPCTLALLCCLAVATTARAQDWVVYEGKAGPGKGKHLVFLTGDEEYRSEEALPLLAKILSQRHGFKCTVLFAVDPDGTINPDNNASLPGAQALDSADAIVMALRFRAWPDETMKHFVDAYLRGVPIVALRTSTHAFRYPAKSKSAYTSFTNFGKRVLGEGWVNHWGKHKKEATRGILEASASEDPILRGVTDIFGDTDVYEVYPPADVKILVRGQVLKGMNPTHPPADYKKTRQSDKQAQGINDPMMPVAWTRLYKNEAGKVNKIFCTTMGSSTDLQSEGLRRLLVNAVYWGLDLEMPAKADVTYVDEYRPTMYGFKGYRRGVKPADLALKVPAEKVNQAAGELPTDWIDPATGHRVIRLSQQPGTSSFYFHQHAFTEKGDKLVVSTRNGLATIDLTTLGVSPCKVEQITQGPAGAAIVGKKTRQVFYVKGGSLWVTHIDTKATREIAKLPPGFGGASGLAVNADETLIASTGNDPKAREIAKARGDPPPKPLPKGAKSGADRSMVLFTVDVKTGEIKRVHYDMAWLNHTQFSPTDPNLILFCHEGTWDYVDRIWTIRTDGTGLRKMHTRTMDREIFGH